MKTKIFLVTILLFLFPIISFSHEYWIDIQNFSPKPNEKVKIFISSGHYFPKSEGVVSERLLSDTKIITPEGEEIVYETREEKNRRVGEFTFKEAGRYIILFSLKKPQEETPLYCGKSIVLVGEQEELNYTSGRYIEIIPLKGISSLKKGEILPIKILYNKQPIKVTFNISIEGKKNFSISSDEEGIAKLKIDRSGRYLITANYKGKGASLTFYIKM
jgi:uncharacterized GH25 family protein